MSDGFQIEFLTQTAARIFPEIGQDPFTTLRLRSGQAPTQRKQLLHFGFRVAKNFGGEGFDFCSCSDSPCCRRQSCFEASLIEEGNAVPSVLHGYLRQQQSSLPNDNLLRRNGLQR